MRSRLRALVVLTPLTFACRPAPATPTETPVEEQQSQAWLAEKERPPTPEKPVRGPIDLVPSDAFAVAEFSRIGDLPKLRDQLPALAGVDPVEEFFDELEDETGVDLSQPGVLQDIGVDPNGPLGIAVIDLPGEAVMTWFGVADEPRLLKRFEKELSEAEELQRGDARIFRFDPSVHFVLRRGYAFVVAVDRPDEATRDHMASLVARRGGQGLGHTSRWERAFRDLDTGHGSIAMRAWISPAAGLDPLLAEMRETEARQMEFHRQQVDAARQTGANPGELRELERQLDESMRQSARMRSIAEAWIRPIESIAFAGSADTQGLWAAGRLVAPESAMVRRIIRQPDRGFVLPRALDHAPVAMLEGAWDMPTVNEFAASLADATGDASTSLFRMFLGFDPRTDLLPLLDGSMGFAVTLDPKQISNSKAKGNPVANALGFVVHMGVRDEITARRFLDDMANSGSFAALKRDRARWKIEVPDWQTIWFDVGGNRVVISSDTKIAGRISNGSSGRVSQPWPNAKDPLQSTTVPTLFSGAWDFAAIGALASADFNSFSMESEWKVRSQVDFGDLEWEERDAITQSSATKSALKKVRMSDKQLAKLQRARSSEIARRWFDLRKALGPTMWSATSEPEQLDMQVRLPFFGGVGAVDAQLANIGGETSVDAMIDKQQKRNDDLVQAAANAWQKDVDRVLRKR